MTSGMKILFLQKIQKSLSQFHNIRLAFLFGSFAGGYASTTSDIDIALLFEKKPDYNILETVKDALSEHTQREIDLLVLNDASPVIKMQVLKKGHLLIKSTPDYEDFFTRTLMDYEDLKIVRKEIEDQILKGRIYA
jgi:predicted nucleotidyltransferase